MPIRSKTSPILPSSSLFSSNTPNSTTNWPPSSTARRHALNVPSRTSRYSNRNRSAVQRNVNFFKGWFWFLISGYLFFVAVLIFFSSHTKKIFFIFDFFSFFLVILKQIWTKRMRGVARDSAMPTYDYHSFENSKRPRVTENAQVRAVSSEAVTKKKKVNDYASEALSDLRRAMKKSLPNRWVPEFFLFPCLIFFILFSFILEIEQLSKSVCRPSFPAFSRAKNI